MQPEHHSPSVRAVLDFYAAVRDSRIEDMLALVDPEVTCQPLVRPGLSFYYGHGDMTTLVHDVHAVHGDYQQVIHHIAEDGPKITVQTTVLHEADGQPPLHATTVFTLDNGLITSIETSPTEDEPDPDQPWSTP